MLTLPATNIQTEPGVFPRCDNPGMKVGCTVRGTFDVGTTGGLRSGERIGHGHSPLVAALSAVLSLKNVCSIIYHWRRTLMKRPFQVSRLDALPWGKHLYLAWVLCPVELNTTSALANYATEAEEVYPHLREGRVENNFGEKPPDRDSNLSSPSSAVYSTINMAENTPESDLGSIECFQNYTAPEVFIQGLAGIVDQQDVESMIIAQKQMLQRFEKTNEMLTNCNALSVNRLKSAGAEFKKHTLLLLDMKKDLDNIFKRIRVLKTKLSTQYPQSFAGR
uniref:KxDL domain-containing protein n=2 Tax=Timema TaxID=61471 RepID=A0A7R9ARH7_TIMSH|nr:unnamed protein product [Timema shepardi]